jgi:hypothetical protein
LELAHERLDVMRIVERFERRFGGAQPFAVDALEILGLDLGRILEDQTGDFTGGFSAIDRSPVTRLDQQGQTPGVIEMPVRHQHGVQSTGIQ